MGDIDIKYARNFLDRINAIQHKGKNISFYFNWNGYNFWHFYQQSVLQDLKYFSRSKKVEKDYKSPLIKKVISGLFLNAVSWVSLIWKMLLVKNEIIIYGIDKINSKFFSDPRQDFLYDYFIKNEINFFEFLHVSKGKNARINFLKRKRPVFYIESTRAIADFLGKFLMNRPHAIDFSQLDLSDFSTKNEKEEVRKIISKCYELYFLSLFRIRLYSFIFRFIKPKVIFLIDDGRHYYYEIILAAKKTKIPTISFQHGKIDRHYVGWFLNSNFDGKYVFPDEYYLWSEYWISELLRFKTFIPMENMFVGGNKFRSSDDRVKKKEVDLRSEDNKTYVILPHEISSPHLEIGEYIKKIVLCDKFKFVLKLRPNLTNNKKESLLYGLDESTLQKIIIDFDIEPYLSKKCVAIGVYSTVLYDVLNDLVPVGILETSSDYGIDMVQNDLANTIERNSDICKKLEEISSLDIDKLMERKNKVFGLQNVTLQNTLDNLVKKYGINIAKN